MYITAVACERTYVYSKSSPNSPSREKEKEKDRVGEKKSERNRNPGLPLKINSRMKEKHCASYMTKIALGIDAR